MFHVSLFIVSGQHGFDPTLRHHLRHEPPEMGRPDARVLPETRRRKSAGLRQQVDPLSDEAVSGR